MKKLLYSIATLATLVFFAGCQREVDIDPVKGELVQTEFVVTLDDATVTKAAINNDAANIDKLIVAAFKKNDGTYLPDLNETNGNFTISPVENNSSNQKQFSVQAKLVRNFQYTIAFFAMHDGAPYTLGTDGSITMAAGATNDETLDAFYKAEDITLDPDTPSSLSKSITLTRPLAQINVLSDPADWAAATTSGITTGLQSSISIAKAPNKLNLYDGAISGETTLEFTQTAIPEGTINVAAANATAVNAHYVAMAYVLSSDTASPVDVTFAVPAVGTDFTGFTRVVENVPNRRNYRTNLHGDLFTTSGNFTVVIDPNFGGNDNQDINIPQPTVEPSNTIPDGISSANPGITTPTIAAGNNVTTNLTAGPLYFGIDSNSDGAITYSSSDHSVGTIDNNGVFTPVGPGTTNITVTQAAGTQTKAIGDPLAEITIVYHVTVEATEYSVTVSGTPENGTVEIKNEAGDAEFTQGISGTKFTVVATPATNYNLGSLVVADTDGNLEASEGKYTIRTSNVTVTATFVAMGQVATPVISPDGGYYTAGEKATITCSEDGAAIYYTLDGTEPTATSTLYEGPIDLTNCTIKAIAIKANMINSAVAEATFTAKIATEIVLADQNLTFGGESITLAPIVKAGSVDVTPVTLSYTAGNDKVTVTTAGVVSAVAAGESSVKINATVPDAYLAPAEKTVAITIAKAASSISWKDGDLEVTVGGSTLDLSDKYNKTEGCTGAVSFAITEGGGTYATISNGVITAVAAGSVKVKATLAGDDNYNGSETAEKTITINAPTVNKYTIDVETNTVNGIVSSNKAEAESGETVTLTLSPAAHYELDELTVLDGNADDVPVTGTGNTRTFTMPASEVSVSATFKAILYTITVDANIDPTKGQITSDVSKAYGETVTILVIPEDGYRLKAGTLAVTGNLSLNEVTAGEEYTFVMPGNAVEITGEFEAIPATTYTITAGSITPASSGSITFANHVSATPIASGAQIAAGTVVDITAAPESGYTLTSLKANGNEITGSGETRSYTMPEADVTITADFEVEAQGLNGDYVILAVKNNVYYGMINESNNAGKPRLKNTTIVYSGGESVSVTDITAVWTINKSGNSYFISPKADNTKYLAWGSTSDNTAIVSSTESSMNIIEQQNGYYIQPSGEDSRYLSANSNDLLFGFYGNTGQIANLLIVPADYHAPQSYNISYATGIDGGSVSGPSSAYENDTVELTATPNSGKQLKKWTVTYGENQTVTVTNDSFTMPAAAVSVSAEFEDAPSGTTYYTKVSSITSGKKYLVVDGSFIFDGSNVGTNTPGISASITSNGIASSSTIDAYAVTITVNGSNYKVQLSTGKYLVINASTSSNGNLTSSDSGEAINIAKDGDSFRFISTNRNTRGVCYRSGTTNCFKNYATSNFGSGEYGGNLDLYEYQGN